MKPAAATWSSPESPLELRRGEVHLWRADLDGAAKLLPRWEALLSASERRLAAQYAGHRERRRFIACRAIARTILSSYLRTSPAAIELREGRHGKPELSDRALRFNVSHSQGLAAYAVAKTGSVGVDVERVRPGVDREVAGEFFSGEMIALLEALPPVARQRMFFRMWTRMEAYAKALGSGLGARQTIARLWRSASSSQLHEFRPRRGYVGAVAARGASCTVRYWQFTVGEL